MSENKGKYPVDVDGDLIEFPDYYHKPAAWIEMKPFQARLEYQYLTKGRSSVRLILTDASSGVRYSLMKNSIDTFIKKSVEGFATGEWIVVKRGANYGLLCTEDL